MESQEPIPNQVPTPLPNQDSKDETPQQQQEISPEAADKLDKEGKWKQAFEVCRAITHQIFGSGLLKPLDLIAAFERMGYISLKQADYKEAHKNLNVALNFKTKFDSNNVLGLARLTGDLGRACFYNGKDSEAWDYFDSSCQMILKQYGENCFDLIGCYNNLAELLQSRKRNDQAVEYLEKAINIAQLYPNKDQGELARSHDLMGRSYCEKRNYEKALEHFNENLKITEQWCGTRKHPDMAACLLSLGNVYDFQGNYQEAVVMYLEALEITVHFSGETNRSVAVCYNNIALVQKKQGNYKSAAENFKTSLEIKIACFGENHPELVSTYNNLGSLYLSIRDLSKALECYDKAFCILVIIHGLEHLSLAQSYDNIAIVYYMAKDFENAEIHHKKALDLRINLLPENHYDFANSYLNMGIVYCELGKWQDAMKNLKTALKISNYYYAEPDMVSYKCYLNMNRVLKNIGNLPSAESSLKKAIMALKAIYGSNPTFRTLKDVKMVLNYSQKKADLLDQSVQQNI